MARAAVVILAGTDGHSNLGRLVNGLETAREFAEAEEAELELIFDGAGTQLIPELEDDDHDGHPSIRSLVDDGFQILNFYRCSEAAPPDAVFLLLVLLNQSLSD